MTSLRSIALYAAVTMGLVWIAGACRGLLPHRILMRNGFMEVRVRGEGVDVTCRTAASYWQAGFLNTNSTGWVIEYGRILEGPKGYGESELPETSSRVMIQTERPLRAGVTYRTDSTTPESRMNYGGVEEAPDPYLSLGAPGVLHVDEANRQLVRGRFHLTLHRLQREGDGPPLVVEGRFEIRRKRPRG